MIFTRLIGKIRRFSACERQNSRCFRTRRAKFAIFLNPMNKIRDFSYPDKKKSAIFPRLIDKICHFLEIDHEMRICCIRIMKFVFLNCDKFCIFFQRKLMKFVILAINLHTCDDTCFSNLFNTFRKVITKLFYDTNFLKKIILPIIVYKNMT